MLLIAGSVGGWGIVPRRVFDECCGAVMLRNMGRKPRPADGEQVFDCVADWPEARGPSRQEFAVAVEELFSLDPLSEQARS